MSMLENMVDWSQNIFGPCRRHVRVSDTLSSSRSRFESASCSPLSTERPLILPIYLSWPAHNLVALTSYTHFCFFVYIHQSARPPWPSFAPFRKSSTSLPISPLAASPLPSHASANPTPSPPRSPSHSSGSSSSLRAFSDYIAETCYWRAQNTPTVLLLLPRAALSLSLLLAFSASTADTDAAPPRDPTYFDANGTLTGYARGVLWANAVWTAWRAVVLLGSV